MKNKTVGFIITGFALILGLITWLYNNSLKKIVSSSCSHGPSCPMWEPMHFQTNVSLIIIFVLIFIGLYLIFFLKDEVYINKNKNQNTNKKIIDKKEYSEILNKLSEDEKYIMNKLIDAQGSLFQSDFINEKYTKVKITRLLDKLEGKGLIERKRRGMTNIVILKH